MVFEEDTKPQKRTATLSILISSLEDSELWNQPCLDFWTIEAEIRDEYCFKKLSLWQFVVKVVCLFCYFRCLMHEYNISSQWFLVHHLKDQVIKEGGVLLEGWSNVEHKSKKKLDKQLLLSDLATCGLCVFSQISVLHS